MPFAHLAGDRLHYRISGDGPAIVFVHGWPASSVFFKNMEARFSRGRTYLALDHLGFGESDKPTGADYSIAGHAGRLARFIESLGRGPVDLVGHSMGGMISLALASRAPELVRSLVAISAPVEGPTSIFPLLRIGTAPILRTAGYPFLKIHPLVKIVSSFFAEKRALPDEVLREVAKPNLVSARESAASLVTTDLMDALPGIRARTLIVYGARDRVVTPLQPLLTLARIPGATMRVLHDVGHCVSLEDPESFAAILEEFLGPAVVDTPGDTAIDALSDA